MSSPRAGYTLPVFACAAAIAALHHIRGDSTSNNVAVDLIEPDQVVEIPIEQVASLRPGTALAIVRSDPGDNLDLTRDTPIWALVELIDEAAISLISGGQVDQSPSPVQERSVKPAPTDTRHPTPDTRHPISLSKQIFLQGGEGIGIHQASGQSSINAYTKRLFLKNLSQWLQPEETLRVTVILPEGKELAKRTSNEAFGVVEGLSLLGTIGISQPLSAPGQLEEYRQELQQKTDVFDCLVFCVGENGLDRAKKLGVNPTRLVKTANWLGPMLVEAGLQGVQSILLFGYHGKLIKLAGNIFHTHHHVADARLEILTAHCANAGLPTPDLQAVFACQTTEDALKYLRELDSRQKSHWVERVYAAIVHALDRNSETYIYAHSARQVRVGTVLFDRSRQIIAKSDVGNALLEQVLLG